jgi:hydrogenase nickel incorporation protein HypB
MCEVCGCGDRNRVSVDLHERILSANDRTAGHNRAHFRARGVLALNLMGSPGAGKTALLEALRRAAPDWRLAAVSGDLATTHDADRLRAAGVPARTITTGTACHLDAGMVHRVLHEAEHDETPDVFVIENVGNLVCPAIYDLGQDANVVALSVTEGVDKPLKYPVMFQAADLVLLTKADLLPHLPEVSVDAVREALARVTPRPSLLVVSARTGEGIGAWRAWIDARRAALQAPQRELDPADEHDPPHAHEGHRAGGRSR